MAEDLSPLSIVLIFLAAVSLAWIFLSTASLRRLARRRHSDVERKLASIEADSRLLKKDAEKLRRELSEKADYQYIAQRIDGLVELLKGG